jgi:hypothetical protein
LNITKFPPDDNEYIKDYYDNLVKNVFNESLVNIDLIIDNTGYGICSYFIPKNITVNIEQQYLFEPDT